MQSYSVEIWDSVDKLWKEVATCRSTSFNVRDLLSDREYKFRVRAINVYGTSEPSQESELTTVGEKPEGKLPFLLPRGPSVKPRDCPASLVDGQYRGTEKALVHGGPLDTIFLLKLGVLDFFRKH